MSDFEHFLIIGGDWHYYLFNIVSIGEKLDIKNVAILESNGTVAAYSHLGGRIGVLLALNKEGQNQLAYDMAMQVAAMNPAYMTPADVPQEIIAKETEIYTEQLKAEGKPADVMAKIIEGKLSKLYKEVCLLQQAFIKDDSKTIETYLKETAGADIQIEKYIRFSLS